MSDAQTSSGNGKDLLQIHASIGWVGKNHTHLRTYDTCVVTKIGVGVRWPFMFVSLQECENNLTG